jgi:hypothetical protein
VCIGGGCRAKVFQMCNGSDTGCTHVVSCSDPTGLDRCLTCVPAVFQNKFRARVIDSPRDIRLNQALTYGPCPCMQTKAFADCDEGQTSFRDASPAQQREVLAGIKSLVTGDCDLKVSLLIYLSTSQQWTWYCAGLQVCYRISGKYSLYQSKWRDSVSFSRAS